MWVVGKILPTSYTLSIMKTELEKLETIDDYIASFPLEVRELLQKMRQTIKKAAPDAEETIKYQIPTFTLKGNLISFAAYKNHIGLYPAPRGTEEFQKELSVYKAEKHSLRFPLDKPIPFDLISNIVKFRVKEHLERAKGKK
jgi:uncharacterized protein YdhG (YjbR/CyaY superfamily)